MSYPPLNPAQTQAVEHQFGPLLVLAGAGSGKTRVITHRIARLIERGIPAESIVALTFTNKAAQEMRERISKILKSGKGGKGVARALTICTFHSFGLSVLTREKAALGGAFTIFDQGDALGTVKEILRGTKVSKTFDAQAIMTRISNAKNAALSAEELPDGDEYDEIAKIVFPKYQAALRQFRAFDFDDLICEVGRLWRERKDVLGRWQERYRFLLVDEYQDTNRAQLELLRLLGEANRNVCVVGDDDQSIYAWRGADVRNILDFEEHFPGAVVVKLEQNYRSCAPILNVANAVIAQRADSKYRKVLFTERAGGEIVELVTAPTPDVEANWVGREVRRVIREQGISPREIAVLYRSNGQSKLIEEALREQGVPHRVIGGQQFFERKEVKDVLAYLKLALNPHDEISLRRIINYPARGIGDTSIERLATNALARGWTFWQAVERVDALDEISSSAREGCKNLERTIVAARQAIFDEKRRASDVLRAICDSIGMRGEIDASSPSADLAQRRWGNIEGIIQTFTRKESRAEAQNANPSDPAALSAFVHALTLDFQEEEAGPPEAVTLSTLHGSKGLEFDVVFLIGCEEGYLPHTRTLETRATDIIRPSVEGQAADIEEERRLFYVGVTRAKQRLVLSHAKGRLVRGKPTPRTPSRFLQDIPSEMVVPREAKDERAMSVSEMAESANALLAALNSL